MNIVAINNVTGKIFESQSYQSDKEKETIIGVIKTEATSAEIEIDIVDFTDEQLQELMAE